METRATAMAPEVRRANSGKMLARFAGFERFHLTGSLAAVAIVSTSG